MTLNLNPGRHRVSVVAVNDLGKERTESFDVIYREPPAPVPAPAPPPSAPAPSRDRRGWWCWPSARAASRAQSAALPSIPFAEEDARDVGAFLGATGGSPRYPRVNVQTLAGPDATARHILDAFDLLDARLRKGELGQGDSVMVLVESHFLGFERQGRLLASDSHPALPLLRRSRPTGCSEVLGQLAEYGCRVLLLVDALHENRPDPAQGNRAVNEWAARPLPPQRADLVASVHGPSLRVNSESHGAFAQGILDSLNVRAQARLQADPRRRPRCSPSRTRSPARARPDRPPAARALLHPRHDPQPGPHLRPPDPPPVQAPAGVERLRHETAGAIRSLPPCGETAEMSISLRRATVQSSGTRARPPCPPRRGALQWH